MWSLLQISERDGISRQAVSKNLKRLLDAGHQVDVERDGRGRVFKVSVAQYDYHRDQFGNSAKQASPVLPPDTKPDGDDPGSKTSRDEALRQAAWLDLERKQLQHQEAIGELVRADKYADAINSAGRIIAAELKRMPNRADAIALAVSKEGEHGARRALRDLAKELAAAIADALDGVTAEVSESDARLEAAE